MTKGQRRFIADRKFRTENEMGRDSWTEVLTRANVNRVVAAL